MKKLLLSIIFALISSVTAFAAQLNPFAYDLYAADDNPSSLADCVKGLHWSLNAKAKTVKLIITDEAGNEYEYRSYGETNSGYYGTSLTRSRMMELNIPFGQNLTWRVDVTGTSPSAPTELDTYYSFWHPHAVAIDNNPNSAHFGRILVTESEPDIPASGYHSSGKGLGLYAFNPDFTVVNAGNVYTGGKDFTRRIANSNGTEGYQPWIVRVSDDSRIFISSGDARTDGTVVWEVNPDNLNEWSDLIKGTLVPYTNQADAAPGVYHVKNASGNFLAGVNCSMDVRGSGSNLKLLLYSTDRRGLTFFVPANYHLHEYTIGTSKSYNGTPTQISHFGSTRYGHANRHAKVYYDGNYGFFFGGIYSSGDENSVPFAHALKSQSGSYTRKVWESTNAPRYTYDGGSGVKIHHSSTGQDWVFKGVKNSQSGDAGKKGKFCVYRVTRSSDGTPVLSPVFTVTSARNGHYINDFALDYAENLYTVDNNAEKIQVYALPYSGKTSTPAAPRYSFNIPCQSGVMYEVTTVCSPPEGGTISCSVAGNAKGAGLLNIESCTELSATAIPEDGYKFIDWRDGNGNFISSSPQLTFMVTDDITLVANFEYAIYNVTWWNLFKDGEDIGKESTAYPGTNERLWRLYQVEFEKYNTSKSGDAVRWHYDSHQPTGVNKLQFNVGAFTYYGKRPTNNYEFLTASTTNQTTPFAWLGDYVEYVSGTTSSKTSHWEYIMYLFFNRTDKAYNATPVDCTSEITWTDKTKSFSKDYGMPEYWRPWWTDSTCGLKKTMSYQESMPVKWTTNSCATGDIAKLGRFNGTAPASNKETQPSLWYKWNTAPDGKSYDQSKYLLAWRDGADGPIVHHASRSNMALYASYVDKVLQESDPDPTGEYDAKNNDVLSLLANDNYGSTTHNVTMDRKFAGGMYNTICLPFDLPISSLPEKLKNADIRVFNGVTETYTESGDPVAVLNFITLDEYWDKWNEAHPDKIVADRYIEAGKPYLIKPSSDVNDEYLTYSGLPYWRFFDGTRTPYGISANGVTFQGVLNPTTLPENAYILVADNRIAKVTDTSDKILGYRGYFVINDMFLRTLADQGNVYFSFKKPVTTSIPVAPEAEQQVKPEVRKVMYDGKIYILRGDEVYTITGTRIR